MDVELYRGREQTYAKHLFLKEYLERVAFHIAYSQEEFIYIDGFSGPWKATNEGLEDTSFMIAIRKLQYVREALGKHRRTPRIRCLFIEADRSRFKSLEAATRNVARLETKALCGDFEPLIPDIKRFIGTGFSFTFIDPTGWDGFAMERLMPLLANSRGEIIVNFMYDHINRFLNDTRPKIETSFNRLFGTEQWKFIRNVADREQIVEFYAAQLQTHGGYPFVTFTPILKPRANRPYFYLVYCTRNIRGLIEFRDTEQRSILANQHVRDAAKQSGRIARTGQQELYPASELGLPNALEQARDKQLAKARERFGIETAPGKHLTYENLLGKLLVLPFVGEKDVKHLIKDAIRCGTVTIEGLSGKQTAPRLHSVLRGRVTSS